METIMESQHETGALELISRAEINQQIATAKKYPRSLKAFIDEASEMVGLTEEMAAECVYSVPRDNKRITGPSARFAEIIVSAWGNCRAGARVISDAGDHVIAQGIFHDLERNTAITFEVQRRIVDKNGRRYSPDMIGTTANAACSIALRNAVLKGIPKALWSSVYATAEKTIRGDLETLAARRASALNYCRESFDVEPSVVFAALGVKGADDIGLDELFALKTLITSIREGDATVAEAFRPPGAAAVAAPATALVDVLSATPGRPEAPQDPPDEGGMTRAEFKDKIAKATTIEQLDELRTMNAEHFSGGTRRQNTIDITGRFKELTEAAAADAGNGIVIIDTNDPPVDDDEF